MAAACLISWFFRHICGSPVMCNPFWPGGDYLGSLGTFQSWIKVADTLPRIRCSRLSPCEICGGLFIMLRLGLANSLVALMTYQLVTQDISND